jgi:hypothetical protein
MIHTDPEEEPTVSVYVVAMVSMAVLFFIPPGVMGTLVRTPVLHICGLAVCLRPRQGKELTLSHLHLPLYSFWFS